MTRKARSQEYNKHPMEVGNHRQVNLILYLNKEWNDSWGGDLEFWDNEKTKCMHTLVPKPNRLAFWIYDADLVHGFPNELQTPKGVSRDNLIFFYFLIFI